MHDNFIAYSYINNVSPYSNNDSRGIGPSDVKVMMLVALFVNFYDIDRTPGVRLVVASPNS